MFNLSGHLPHLGMIGWFDWTDFSVFQDKFNHASERRETHSIWNVTAYREAWDCALNIFILFYFLSSLFWFRKVEDCGVFYWTTYFRFFGGFFFLPPQGQFMGLGSLLLVVRRGDLRGVSVTNSNHYISWTHLAYHVALPQLTALQTFEQQSCLPSLLQLVHDRWNVGQVGSVREISFFIYLCQLFEVLKQHWFFWPCLCCYIKWAENPDLVLLVLF